MISDFVTNTIYFSGVLRTKYPETCQCIEQVLISSDIALNYLPNTKDIWARDYMPMQVTKDKFIKYRYDPDYLQAKKYRKLKSYPDIICDTIGLKTEKTDIILDGGNVIKSNNCVILTDKVVQENHDSYSKNELIIKLHETFEVDKVVLIPWDKEEIYGHADGMIRFIDENTVLIQDYYDEYSKTFRNRFYGALEDSSLNWVKLKFDGNDIDERSWSYMNFLQTKDIILLPSFGIPEDKVALEQIKEYYPDYAESKIHQIDWNEMIDGDGGLNCISWTIMA